MSKSDDQRKFREWHRTKVAYEKTNRLPIWDDLSVDAQQQLIEKYKTEGKL